MTKQEKQAIQKLLEVFKLAESCLLTHHVQTVDPPWAGNEILEGCIRGSWMDTPELLAAAIRACKQDPVVSSLKDNSPDESDNEQ